MIKTIVSNRTISVPSHRNCGEFLAFEMQPIVDLRSNAVAGYELLYRGLHPTDWSDVDDALIHFLSRRQEMPPLFVNLSDHGLMRNQVNLLVATSKKNDVIFELSESVTAYSLREKIAVKANELIARGVRFAVDDFGAGRDSLERLYALSPTKAVKIDSAFLQTCARRTDAASTLRHLIGQWRSSGVWSIAEGVENAQLYEFACSIGVDMVQGWHIDAMANQAPLMLR